MDENTNDPQVTTATDAPTARTRQAMQNTKIGVALAGAALFLVGGIGGYVMHGSTGGSGVQAGFAQPNGQQPNGEQSANGEQSTQSGEVAGGSQPTGAPPSAE